jgi:outer membrane protein insertion porin family
LLALTAGGSRGWAQAAPARPAGQAADPAQPAAPVFKVGTITVKFVGTANVNEQVVRANVQMHEGGDLDETMIDRDIKSLYRTNLFEYVQVKHEPVVGANTINLVIEVTPKFRVLSIKFEGNAKISSRQLLKETKSKTNLALDERQVKEDAEKIRDYYQKEGYNQVSVTYAIDRDRSAGYGTVTFKIKEGNKVKIADVRFTGNTSVKTKVLRSTMDTKKWWMFSWLTGSGRFKDDTFDDDLDKLRDYYREHGFLDVEIAPEKIQYDYPKPDKLVITIAVTEGRQYHVGEISISGNKIYPSELLKHVIHQHPGAIFAPSKLDKDVETLTDFHTRGGYLDTRVYMKRNPNLSTGNIDIEYQVTESEKFNVESITLEGNTKTMSTVILRELTLGPGDVFNTVSMKISKLTLDNTRFFDSVDATDEATNLPGRRNLKIAVKEGRTGNLQFGAGFSSLEQGTLFIELSQSNFDIFNHGHSFFQGDGQKFRLRLQLGSKSNEIITSFEEPWLFQKRLALGFSLFRTSSDYSSSFYREVRTGATVYLRKMLLPQLAIEGTLSYTYEIVTIDNIDTNASAVIQSLAGQTKISKLSFQFLRDTRDKIINTTSGNRIELDTDVAGGPFGGDENYYALEFRGSDFLPLFQTQAQVLSLIGRFGVKQNFGRSPTVPYYDRFFLGGPNDLRGFENRDVGPRDSLGEPIGGKSYGFFSAEYTLDIVSPIRFAVFYDAGFVNQNAYDFSPVNYNDDFGVGLRLFVAGAPVALDLGIPLTHDLINKKGNQFNFSFGTRF